MWLVILPSVLPDMSGRSHVIGKDCPGFTQIWKVLKFNITFQGFRQGGGGGPDLPTQHQRGRFPPPPLVGKEKNNISHILLTFQLK